MDRSHFSRLTGQHCLKAGLALVWLVCVGSAYGQFSITEDLLFNNYALISNNTGSDNIDHIWHHDGAAGGAPGTWSFVSDGTYKGGGNSRLYAGHVFMTGINQVNYFKGKIAIGTMTPAYSFELRENRDGMVRAAIRNDSSGASAQASLMLLSNSTAGFDIISWGSGASGDFAAFPKANSVFLRTHSGSPADRMVIGTGSNAPIHFITGDSHQVTIAGDGNVGIGTSNPANKLEVNGRVRAEEIIVETGWADFVFDDAYELPSLQEVKAHIAQEGHLPGIPSEAEVLEEGVSLGETQRLLLQKIEELTLYLIEQDSVIKEQQSQITQLRGELDKLKE